MRPAQEFIVKFPKTIRVLEATVIDRRALEQITGGFTADFGVAENSKWFDKKAKNPLRHEKDV